MLLLNQSVCLCVFSVQSWTGRAASSDGHWSESSGLTSPAELHPAPGCEQRKHFLTGSDFKGRRVHQVHYCVKQMMNLCTTSVERMGELYLGARYGSAGVDGSTGGRSVGVYEESDWGRSSPSMHLRLAMLLPTAASVLSLFLSAGPGEL